ncbi:hypothetical protein B0H14DRAFT_2820650 [Mycena olivaceomarginata]|nr:hypothetical protein B0H14DRAFT_2820650 [Mycena olivaceomarginata]
MAPALHVLLIARLALKLVRNARDEGTIGPADVEHDMRFEYLKTETDAGLCRKLSKADATIWILHTGSSCTLWAGVCLWRHSSLSSFWLEGQVPLGAAVP